MPRPTTKKDLITAGGEQFKKLWEIINSMPDEIQNAKFEFEDRDKNIRDVLIHLYEWHQLLLNWVNSNKNGEGKSFLPEQYNWKTYPEMNVKFWEMHQETPYEKSKEMLKESHTKVMNLVEAFSDDELFIKKYFPWTGTSNVAAYFISATSSHYDWAMKKIKNHIKTYK